MILCQPRPRYTAAVTPARQSATAADHRAYFAASLLFIVSVKQNLAGLYSRACADEGGYPALSALAAGASGRIPIFAAATLSRFVFFTRYIASSARCSSPSFVRESTG